MKKVLLLLTGVTMTLTSCQKEDDAVTCRCQAATDAGFDVYIEKECDLVTEADLDRVLIYAGSRGANYVYVDTATNICN